MCRLKLAMIFSVDRIHNVGFQRSTQSSQSVQKVIKKLKLFFFFEGLESIFAVCWNVLGIVSSNVRTYFEAFFSPPEKI